MADLIMDSKGIKAGEYAHQNVYELIGKAIGKIGAIGKDKRNPQQGFMYRGIDQVYNALNPVMAELGLFFCPEIIDQKREERTNAKGTVLIYTILTIRYTVYAPDGSSVSTTVVGEAMDSGDKSANKAMSAAMKYAMFQLFCIPTEELKDPDAEVHEVMPKGTLAAKSAPVSTTVGKVDKVPATEVAQAQEAPKKPETPGGYLTKMITELNRTVPGFNFVEARRALIEAGKVEDIPSATITMDQAKQLMTEMVAYYAEKKEEK